MFVKLLTQRRLPFIVQRNTASTLHSQIRWTVSKLNPGNTVQKVCRTCKTIFGPHERHCPTHQGYLLLHSLVGDTLRERYLVEEQIGGNAHSLVFRARDLELNTSVAVKALLLDADGYRYPRDRIIREAETYVALSDPRFPRVFARGELEDGRPYYVYEHVNGPNLGQVIEADGPLAGDRAVRIAAQIAAALAEAHDHKFVHQNLHPHAIMIYRDQAGLDIVKIIDFGMVGHARVTGDAVASQTAVRPLGIVGYMSPEQWDGQTVDERTDIYSLGVMLYEMVAATLPYTETDKNRLKELVCNVQPVRPSEKNPNITVYSRLEDVIMQLIATDRERRPPRMLDVCMMLEEALESRDALQQADVVASMGFASEFGPFDKYVPPVPPDNDVAEAMLIAGPHDELLPPAPGLRFTPPPQPVEEAELVDELGADAPTRGSRTKTDGIGRFGPFDEPASSVFALDANAIDFADDDEPGFEDYIDEPPKPVTPADGTKVAGAARASSILSNDIFDSKPASVFRVDAAFGNGSPPLGVGAIGEDRSLATHWGRQPDIDTDLVRQGAYSPLPTPSNALPATHRPGSTPIPGRTHPAVLQREEQSYQAMLEDSNPSAPRPMPQRKKEHKGVSMPFVVSVVILSGFCGVTIVLWLWQLPSNSRNSSQLPPSADSSFSLPKTDKVVAETTVQPPTIPTMRPLPAQPETPSGAEEKRFRRPPEVASARVVESARPVDSQQVAVMQAAGAPAVSVVDSGSIGVGEPVSGAELLGDSGRKEPPRTVEQPTEIGVNSPSPDSAGQPAASASETVSGGQRSQENSDTASSTRTKSSNSKKAEKNAKKSRSELASANPADTKSNSDTPKSPIRDVSKPGPKSQTVEQSDFKTF